MSTTPVPEDLNITSPSPVLDAPIEIPFAIAAAFTALVGLSFLVLYFIPMPSPSELQPNARNSKKSNDSSRSDKSIWSKLKCGEDDGSLYIGFVLFLCIFFILPTGAERAYGRFIYAYAIEGPHQFSTGDGTMIESLFWLTFTGTRIVTMIISFWVSATILISTSLVLSVGVSIALAFAVQTNSTLLWVFNCGFGIVLAPLMPASIAWADSYVIMSPMMTALAFISAATGSFIFSWLSGSLYQNSGPQSLMHLILVYSIITTLVFSVLYLLGRKRGTRKQNERNRKGESKEHDGQNELDALHDTTTQNGQI